MIIKPEDKIIRDILLSGAIFLIPRFQREYSWDKANYREFLEDMVNSLSVSNGKITAGEYFMGTMLFTGELKAGKEVSVVDGQQRLTTITILFSALSDHFREESDEDRSKHIFKYIMNNNDDGEEVRTLQTKTNYPYFAYFIQDREKLHKINADSEEENCIYDAYNFLYEQTKEKNLRKRLKLRNGSEFVDSLDYIDILSALRDQILHTIVVTISTTDKTYANMIFEILNAKGKRLANIDLIKNKLFEVLNDTSPADYADETWNGIKNTLYNGNANIGFATFYSHFWASKYKKTYSNKLYDDFNQSKNLPKTKESYMEFLEEMKKNAKWYIQITAPTRAYWKNRKEYYSAVQYLDHLSNDFSIVQSRIALLALFDIKERGLITQSRFIETISKMERFHYAYNSICSEKTSRLEKVYSDFAIGIRKSKDKSEAESFIVSLFSKLNSMFPSYDKFESRFSKLVYSKKPHPDNIKTKYAIYMLYGLAEGTGDYLYPDNGSIEHILPESNGEDALNIGNLIALEGPINQACDTKEYVDKIEYYKTSKYNCVKQFVDQHQEWSKSDIEERAKEMAHSIYYDVLLK